MSEHLSSVQMIVRSFARPARMGWVRLKITLSQRLIANVPLNQETILASGAGKRGFGALVITYGRNGICFCLVYGWRGRPCSLDWERE